MQNDWANKIQLIRTIERVAAERMGEVQATQFFKDLAISHGPDKSHFGNLSRKFWDEAYKLAQGVIEPSKLKDFVKEMVKGRFGNVPVPVT